MPKKKIKRKIDKPEESFEESLAELESVVADLESGELGLAESLERYEQGVQRLKRCHATLETAQRRIELLSGVDADGNPVTAPFDHSAEIESAEIEGSNASAGSRSRKRTASSRGTVDDDSRLF